MSELFAMSNQKSLNIFYRDLRFDFWRICAIVLVVLHHLMPLRFPDAYVGVDLFIVIAGFLCINGISRRSDWASYFRARFIRIYPELLLLLLICIPICYYLLTNQRLRDVGSTIAASTLSAVNILFTLKKDYAYGLPDASANPLTHLWSLSLEIQFYTIAPLMIGILQKCQKLIKILLLLLVFISSFLLSLDQSQSSYYMLPSRLWEFMVGMAIAIYINSRNLVFLRTNSWFFGVVTLIIFFISSIGIEFIKGVYLQISVILIASIGLLFTQPILSTNSKIDNFVRRIGQETYLFYLTHYPAIIFSSLISVVYDINFLVLFICIFIFLNFYISNVRNKILLNLERRLFNYFIIISIGTCFLCGYYFWSHSNERDLYTINGSKPHLITKKGEMDRLDGICNTDDKSALPLGCILGTGPIKVALIGDSFGASLATGFDSIVLKDKYQVHQITKNGCPFSLTVQTIPDRKCKEFNSNLLQYVRKIKPDIILVQYRWWSYAYRVANYNLNGAAGYIYCNKTSCDKKLRPGVDGELIKSYIDSLSELTKLGARVVIVAPTPEYEEMIPETVAFINSFRGTDDQNVDLIVRKITHEISDNIFREMRLIPGIDWIDIRPLFIFGFGKFHAFLDGNVLFYDTNHITEQGARLVWDEIDSVLTKNLDNPLIER